MKCLGCNTGITEKNDGLSLTRQVLSESEMGRLKLNDKGLCVKCKRESMFAGLMKVI